MVDTKGASAPLRIQFIALGPGMEEEIKRNKISSSQYQMVEFKQPTEIKKLAVVGGSPEILKQLDELIEFDGDIWGVNQCAHFLGTHGIKATAVSVDPSPFDKNWIVDEGIFADVCDPLTFESVSYAKRFILDDIPGGVTTATRMPLLALKMGYTHVTFYGCSSSYGERKHAYAQDELGMKLIVRADGKDYITNPELVIQAQHICELCEQFPMFIENRSGGLSEAMQRDKNWEVVAVSAEMRKHLYEFNGDNGLWETEYRIN